LRRAGFAVDGFHLNGDFLLLVAAPPAALVQSFMQSDAVDPGAQGRLRVEGADVAEDFDEDFLGEVGGVGGVANGAGEQAVDGLVVAGDEPRERFL
jgi:hypothetical protein